MRRIGERLHPFFEELLELLFKVRYVTSGVTNDARRDLVEQQRVQEVFERYELMVPARSLRCGHGKGNLDFWANAHIWLSRCDYSGSAVTRSGIPCSRAKRVTWATLVSA